MPKMKVVEFANGIDPDETGQSAHLCFFTLHFVMQLEWTFLEHLQMQIFFSAFLAPGPKDDTLKKISPKYYV